MNQVAKLVRTKMAEKKRNRRRFSLRTSMLALK
jgi:hypothetical protein